MSALKNAPQGANEVRAPSAQESAPIETQELLLRLRQVTLDLEGAKALYAEADALTAELVRRGFTRAPLPDGTEALLRDNFWDAKANAPRNVAWKSCGIRRFEVDFTDAVSAKRSCPPPPEIPGGGVRAIPHL
jgi:hypothetical protein